eukprot:1009841-Amphidinium_carterae.1
MNVTTYIKGFWRKNQEPTGTTSDDRKHPKVLLRAHVHTVAFENVTELIPHQKPLVVQSIT